MDQIKRMLTKDHVQAVRKKFPYLHTTFESCWFVVWEGRLAGFDQFYKVRIIWTRFSPWENIEMKITDPCVYILDPPLQDREDSLIPHLYERNSVPYLCLYDPQKEHWEDNERSIADTIIPWASEWLANYELWRTTGKWYAPERHPERTSPCNNNLSNRTLSQDQRGLSIGVVNVYLGQKIGTLTSFPLMVAASEGFIQPLSWRDWRKPTLMEILSQITSTLSPVHPQAALSPLVLQQDYRPANLETFISIKVA